MRKLASEYGVSLATVQSALQMLQARGIVDLQNRRGVFVSQEQGRSVDSSLVGLLVPFRESEVDEAHQVALMHHLSFHLDAGDWMGRINRSCEQALRSRQFDFIVLPVPIDELGLASAVGQRIDRLGVPLAGVLCYGGWGGGEAQAGEPLISELDARDIPWISINPFTQYSAYNFVASDNLHGGRRVGRCLSGMDLRHVLVLSRPLDSYSTDVEKVLGLYQGYLERAVAADRIVVRSVAMPDETAGYRATKAYLAEGAEPPQGIFAISDYMAIGAIRALREAGLNVPQDVGVIGATDLHAAAHFEPPLTTLAQPMEEMGRQAASMLSFMIREGVRRMVGRRVPGPMRFRQSIDISPQMQSEADHDYQQAVKHLETVVGDTVDTSLGQKDASSMSRTISFSEPASGE